MIVHYTQRLSSTRSRLIVKEMMREIISELMLVGHFRSSERFLSFDGEWLEIFVESPNIQVGAGNVAHFLTSHSIFLFSFWLSCSISSIVVESPIQVRH